IAEQMGMALQKTSVSTNVKERLDFSCAIFDADGGLVANAPHLPVHLGMFLLSVASLLTGIRLHVDLCETTSGDLERKTQERGRHCIKSPVIWRNPSSRCDAYHASI